MIWARPKRGVPKGAAVESRQVEAANVGAFIEEGSAIMYRIILLPTFSFRASSRVVSMGRSSRRDDPRRLDRSGRGELGTVAGTVRFERRCALAIQRDTFKT